MYKRKPYSMQLKKMPQAQVSINNSQRREKPRCKRMLYNTNQNDILRSNK